MVLSGFPFDFSSIMRVILREMSPAGALSSVARRGRGDKRGVGPESCCLHIRLESCLGALLPRCMEGPGDPSPGCRRDQEVPVVVGGADPGEVGVGWGHSGNGPTAVERKETHRPS